MRPCCTGNSAPSSTPPRCGRALSHRCDIVAMFSRREQFPERCCPNHRRVNTKDTKDTKKAMQFGLVSFVSFVFAVPERSRTALRVRKHEWLFPLADGAFPIAVVAPCAQRGRDLLG